MGSHPKLQYLVPEPPDEPVACRVPGSPPIDPLRPLTRRRTSIRQSVQPTPRVSTHQTSPPRTPPRHASSPRVGPAPSATPIPGTSDRLPGKRCRSSSVGRIPSPRSPRLTTDCQPSGTHMRNGQALRGSFRSGGHCKCLGCDPIASPVTLRGSTIRIRIKPTNNKVILSEICH
jgi:hypothetical protein